MGKKSDIAGIIPPLVTPFKKDGGVDLELFTRDLHYVAGCGVHGLSIGGSTGEGAFLDDAELETLVATAKKEAPAGMPIVSGIIRPSLGMALKTAMAVKKAGADALMVTPTYYNILVPNDDGNYAFYKALSDAAKLPIIIYNVVPQNEISPKAMARLLEIPHVAGVKQSVGGVMGCYGMLLENSGKTLVYSATDEMIFTTFQLGVDGAISAILSLLPKASMRMWEMAKAGDTQGGLAIQGDIFALWKVIGGPQFPARMKAVLREMGRDCGLPRSPLHETDEAFRAAVRAVLAKMDSAYS
jgi:Dihydrodipicolinate synthase/N-acetylneuraminate lyase